MTDLISRRAAIKAIDDLPNCYNGYSDTYDKAYIIGTLEEVPTIEPKKGRWKDAWMDRQCSLCGIFVAREIAREANFCPNCGARMERSEE